MGKYDALTPIVEETRARQPVSEPRREKKSGKSANRDEYRQISVYIRRAMHNDAQRALIGSDEDFSDLVNRLVQQWLINEIK